MIIWVQVVTEYYNRHWATCTCFAVAVSSNIIISCKMFIFNQAQIYSLLLHCVVRCPCYFDHILSFSGRYLEFGTCDWMMWYCKVELEEINRHTWRIIRASSCRKTVKSWPFQYISMCKSQIALHGTHVQIISFTS